MTMKKNNDVQAEIRAFVKDEQCDVLLSGTPDDLLRCMCSVIKALGVRLSQEEELKELQQEMDVSDELMQTYLSTMVVSEILETLECVNPLLTHFEAADDDNVTVSDVLEDWYKQITNSDNNINIKEETTIPNEAESELDFDAFWDSEEAQEGDK